MKVIEESIEFEWDEGNREKNKKHRVEDQEAEEVFFDEQKKTFADRVHSQHEERFRVIGKTKQGKLLFVVFTMRRHKIRIISVRMVNRKEACLYEKTVKTS